MSQVGKWRVTPPPLATRLRERNQLGNSPLPGCGGGADERYIEAHELLLRKSKTLFDLRVIRSTD
jgi:hypothetical protein